MTIESKRLILKPFEESCINEDYISWLNDKDHMRYSQQRNKDHSFDSSINYLNSFKDSDDLFFSIDLKGINNKQIGTITAYKNDNLQSYDMGVLIGRGNEGKGYGLEAWSSLMNYLFNEGVSKITAGTIKENKGMLKIMEDSGMVEDSKRMIEEPNKDIIYVFKLT